jgi:hypothetical protein
MRRLWPVALLVILGAGLGGRATSAPSAPQPGEPFLPDLKTLDPSDFFVSEVNGTRLLLLSNTIWNAGDGPLEMRPENDEEAGITYAFQLLFSEDDEGNLYVDGERPAGSFAFHPSHHHWHFQDLARYSLVERKPDGSLGETVASSDKISFCMFDQRQIDGTLENAASDPFYSGFACDQNENVGYSVGWGDEYGYNFADQDIDITGVPPGNYWVVSKADPERLIDETNNNNNGAKAAVKLTEDDVLSLTRTTGSICSPCEREDLFSDKRYLFEGSTDPTPSARPGSPDPEIVLSFKRPGGGDWKPFGGPDSDRAFTLFDESDGPIEFDGSWHRHFFPHKSGPWVIRARYAGNDRFTGSAEKISVTVSN